MQLWGGGGEGWRSVVRVGRYYHKAYSSEICMGLVLLGCSLDVKAETTKLGELRN